MRGPEPDGVSRPLPPGKGVGARGRRTLCTLLLALPLPPALSQPPLDLPTLMQRMARRKGGEARFTEERSVGGLDAPLYASGTLSFSAPSRFVRQTLQPTRETMELDGRTLRLVRGGRTRQLDLDSVPEVAALLEAMRATLTGDLPLLRRHFRAELSGEARKWVLALTPLDARLAVQLHAIEIVGQDADLRSILLQLKGGDRSLMLVEPLVETK